MPINDPAVRPQVRQPRSILKINGAEFAAGLSWEVDGNTMFQADTFRATLATSKLPAANGVDWFAAQTKLEVEVFAGFPSDPDHYTSADLTSIFFGQVDEGDFRFTAFTIDLSGRDLTAALIDHKTSEKFPNQTSSEIATMLAGRRGLAPVVTATKTKVGRYYQIDRVRLQDDRTEWDLLTWLAREESFIVYVQGKELHFEPKPDESKSPYLIQWTAPVDGGPPSLNGATLDVTKTYTIAKDIKVTVRSWNAKHKKAFAVTATRQKKGPGEIQEFSYTIAGLTAEQAQQRANQLLDELSRHEVKLSYDGPGDNLLGKADVIQLKGTAFDQVFYPDTIVRSFDAKRGYQMRLGAKNRSPESEPSL